MSGAAFLITTDRAARDPKLARQLVRANDFSSLSASKSSGAGDVTKGVLNIPEDAVLLMIGNTNELLTACEATLNSEGITRIETKQGHYLAGYFVRISVSPVQVDTLIAIGCAQDYWQQASPSANSWRPMKHSTNTTAFYLQPNPQPDCYLADMINDCKAQSPKGFI
jgi:hypothetical protein